MTNDGRVYDGDDVAIGQDCDTHPSYLPPGIMAKAINRTFRGGINRCRPSIGEIDIQGERDAIDEIQTLNIQGAMAYSARTPGAYDGIIMAAGGNIYFLTIVNGLAYCSKIYSGYNPFYYHTWFCQAENRVYIQNGQQNPLVWDGDPLVPAQQLNPFNKKVPVGTVMAYLHGRLFVSTKKNEIFASDIIFGSNATNTNDTENFTETTYWAEGGSFLAPPSMGNITGMYGMPSLGTSDRGQGELVVLCERGAFAMPVQIPRVQWKDSQMQNITLIGRGCVSPWSIAGVNNQLWYRAYDGWAFYGSSQGDFQRNFSYRKLSREVNEWVGADTKTMMQYASSAYWNNYLLMTVSPFTVQTQNEGGIYHRAHRGIVALDLDSSANASPDAGIDFRWSGLWTGIRPIQLVKAHIAGVERCFAFSFDRDGKNRLYEIGVAGEDDFSTQKTSKIVGQFWTRRYSFSGRPERYILKELNGGEITISEIRERVGLKVEYRGDSTPCWSEFLPDKEVGCDYCEQEKDCDPDVSEERYSRVKLPTPSAKDCNAAGGKARVATEFQLRVTTTGRYAVDRFRISAQGNVPDPPAASCGDNSCEPIKCCSRDEFDLYYII